MASVAVASPSKRRRASAEENQVSLDNVVQEETPRKMPRSANKRQNQAENASNGAAVVAVTPSSRQQSAEAAANTSRSARRNILAGETPAPERNHVITPSKEEIHGKPPAKRRLMFGRLVEEIPIRANTKLVYSLVKKLTGSIGGNGSCGPIYGELTMGSMQRMVNLMKQYTHLNSESRFIDVGSGIGKPNMHVMQDPGVAFSCGIEMELDRWRLGLKCLQKVLHEASEQEVAGVGTDKGERIRHNCTMIHGNIMEAKTFDPFTHVYMCSIG